MLRLFVALRPPPPIRRLLLETMGGIPGARWQDDAQLHLTLRFIGEVSERVAEDIDLALGSIRSPAIVTHVERVGQFAKRGRTTALWAAIAPWDGITDLHHKIDAALVRVGQQPEHRAYLPHITVARLNVASASAEGWLRDNVSLSSGQWSNESFGLYRSDLARGGARYERIARYTLYSQ